MSLTITDEETCRLAAELVELTGETPDDAIAAALRESLRRARIVAERAEALVEIGKQTAELLRGSGLTSTNIGDFLYDERGLPKGKGNDFARTDLELALD